MHTANIIDHINSFVSFNPDTNKVVYLMATNVIQPSSPTIAGAGDESSSSIVPVIVGVVVGLVVCVFVVSLILSLVWYLRRKKNEKITEGNL